MLDVLRSRHLSLDRSSRASRECSRNGWVRLRGRGLQRHDGVASRVPDGIGAGDEVITSYSFVASANCFMYEGADPVFADIDPQTFNLDPEAVEAAITEKTRAIVAVDIFGYPCELGELLAICERHGLTLIRDSAEALGAEYKDRRLGSHGHMAIFAFYPNKMTTAEGGVVTTGLRGAAGAARQPAQPGARGHRRVARPLPLRFQLPPE